MNSLVAAGGWSLLVLVLEFLTWRIFFAKTVRICFLTEPDLPLSRFLTIGTMRVLTIIHAFVLMGIIAYFHFLLW